MAKKTSTAKKRDSLRMLIVEARFYDNISDELFGAPTACSTKRAPPMIASPCRARSKYPPPSP